MSSQTARKTLDFAGRTWPLVALSLAASLVVPSSESGVAEDIDPGARLAAVCAACHDPSGRDHGIPPIAGLDEKRITEAMRGYRASETPSLVMHAIALSLSDEELASVARFLATPREDSTP